MLDSLPVRVKLVGVSTDAVPMMRGSIAVINGIPESDHQESANPGIILDALPSAQQLSFSLSHIHIPIGRISITAFPPFTTSPRVM